MFLSGTRTPDARLRLASNKKNVLTVARSLHRRGGFAEMFKALDLLPDKMDG
jgi:hypothetical protein